MKPVPAITSGRKLPAIMMRIAATVISVAVT
jgi:hypothetical protein